jgi:hypothetical protein
MTTCVKSQIDLNDIIESLKKLYENKEYTKLIKNYEEIISFKNNEIKKENNEIKKENNEIKKENNDIYKYYSNLSFIYHIIRNFQESKKYALLCIESNPEWYKGYYRLAQSYQGLKDYENTKIYYDIMNEKIENHKNTNDIKLAEDYKNKEDIKICINDSNNINVNIMKEWLIDNGANVESVNVDYIDVEYRGISLNRNIPASKNVLEIPRKCLVSLEESKKNGINKTLIDLNYQYMSPHTYLAIKILEILNDPSDEFNYYLKCLPKSFNNVPINFSDEEKSYLEGSYSLVKIQQKLQVLRKEYFDIKSLLENNNINFHFHLKDFIWARTCIITRVYAVDIGGVKDTIMGPLADMANHSLSTNTHWYYDNKTNMFIVQSKDYLRKGAEIYESYGPKCNYRYFVNYGFTMDNNPFEEVCLAFDPKISNIIYKKSYYLSDSDISNNDNEYLSLINRSEYIYQVGYQFNDVVKKMIDDTKNMITKVYNDITEKSLNKYIFQFIQNVVKITLDQFDNDDKDDENLLLTFDYTFNIKNCIIQRKEEKKVLLFYNDFCQTCIDIYETSEDKEIKKIKKKFCKKYNRSHYNSFVNYIKILN